MLRAITPALLAALFFALITPMASATCLDILAADHPVQVMYKKMTATSNWGGSTVQIYFRNRDKKVNIQIHDQSFLPYLQFTYDLFNNPEVFRNFAIEVYSSASSQSANLSSPPTREDLLKQLYGRLQAAGFLLQEAPKALSDEDFYNFIKNGILLLEKDPLFLANQHGHDTHIIQLAYLTSQMEHKFGSGSTLSFFKYIGSKAPFVWNELFDNVGSDDLSNPSMVSNTIRRIGLK